MARYATPAMPPGAPTTRDEVLDAYRAHIKDARAKKKKQHKQVILEDVRRRPPRLHLRQEPLRVQHVHPHHDTQKKKENPTRLLQGGNYLKRFLFRNATERPEGWAAAKINRAMRRYYRMHLLLENRDEKYLALQSKLLFDECCKCRPLVPGPMTTESGVLRLAEPNLPKILRILQNEANDGLDLLQPHGLDQYTVMHAAAQRGYTDLANELIMHWNECPMNSPYQKYSFMQLSHLLELVLEMRKAKRLVSESDAEMRALIADVGVSFARFSDSLDKLHEEAITLQDLLQICGHPLVLSRDAAGNTPLHYAAEGGHLTLSKLLLANGANINAQNKSGETPLHFAIASQRHGVCLHFVENHADVRISRYVSFSTLNGTVLRGTFVESPDGKAMAKLLPSLNFRSGAMVQQKRPPDSKIHLPQYQTLAGGTAAVSPEIAPGRANVRHDAVGTTNDSACTTVDTLLASPFLCTRNRRDIVFFRSAPGYSILPPKTLGVLVVSEHVAPSELNKVRDLHEKSKLFHLLIQNVPEAAVLAMDSFRNPLFRCSMQKHVRERNQRWTVSNQLKTYQEKRDALTVQMKGKGGRSPRRKRKQGSLAKVLSRLRKLLKKAWKFLRRVRNVLSVQHVFTVTEDEARQKDTIVCEPKGILYEYVYDHAEFRGRHSLTLWLIVQTECKDLIFHPWFRQLLEHKWNSFTKQTFRYEFKVYFVYFVAVFVATYVHLHLDLRYHVLIHRPCRYLHIGDTFVGMPIGGYRNNIFNEDVGVMEYVRDAARLIYSVINAMYTFQEAVPSLSRVWKPARVPARRLELVRLTSDHVCVAVTASGNSRNGIPRNTDFDNIYSDFDQNDFRLIVYQESLYSFNIRRRYNFRITLMSIVGPQIFVKWIQFARGTRALGPFVRMIAKMFSDILVFVVMFCVFLCGFAFAFFILQLEGCKNYFSAVTTTFNISLGSWDWDSIYEGGLLAILLFLAFVVIGTIMLLNLLIAMMGNTYDKVWEDRLLFFELERAKATLSIQSSLDDEIYDEKHWCPRLYVLEGDTPIEGIQFRRL
ncbi:Transient receptor potential cation channel subfamily V member 1 [Phytophthora citrophthora]|uniref:Transient receptor potential cation channel subfamily V member 1 n=1 Tax=Phytophthora citrophthora TaxID=4793 RepID=A0AAD9H0G3_9STRA|nr:Transient receptor potential cation channel subfamily V member 1 [Phytophthora citrophthora]